MDMTFQSALMWSEREFSGADLGDVRRDRRLVQMGIRLVQTPSGVLPEAFTEGQELKAAYRFLNQAAVTPQAIQTPHFQRVLSGCREPGEYLMIEDTTILDYAHHPAVKGLGWLVGEGQGQGLFVHSTLAVRIAGWTGDSEPIPEVVGLLGQQRWVRRGPAHHRQRDYPRLSRRRESQRWGRVFAGTGGPPHGVQWTLVADREGDIYEVIQDSYVRGIHVILRSSSPRILLDEEGSTTQKVARSPVRGRFSLPLRARPGQPARTATLEVRAIGVQVRAPMRPGGRPSPFAVHVVEARERSAPPKVEPLHWVLLTDWPIDSFTAVLRVIRTYADRFLIEEYHKALKTGTRVEASQLETRKGLENLLAVLAVVAVRLLAMKLRADADPDTAVPPAAMPSEVWAVLETKFPRPATGWTNRTLVVAVARVGGFLARRSDGNPGWQTLWRGWRKLMLLAEGYQLAHPA